MTDMEKLKAVAWAAVQAGKTYGEFSAIADSHALKKVYSSYTEEMARRHERVKQKK